MEIGASDDVFLNIGQSQMMALKNHNIALVRMIPE